ncbi:uncharacterized protein DNG_03538 [Cephalotrichum gorgonifer]|uniref:Mso1 N-terminal domain-containing protein n=1 Tax=Cephalotrichum gorgonifer TaxID=2041049 RepID=A0AAE8MX70_9PEZI|nr:uncharacterized protein DNG_03538 [Cephalotrichum gorgonifer]
MASWYSKLLTTTTSQISNLQSRILQGENDGDTEDDTHVCRVLRAHYTEQGKPFPGWLPPDPKAPPPVAAVYSQPQVGSRYGGLAQQQGGGGSATGLSSLWGDNSGGARQQQGAGLPQSGSLRQNQYSRGGGVGGGNGSYGRNEAQARPLPSQRGGSYQQSQNFGRDSGNTPPPASGGSSAQDKLKQRLWGGGARTTSPSSGSSGPFQPPRQGGNSAAGGGGGGGYGGRSATGGSYDSAPSANRGGDRPFMAANSPWASSEDDYNYGSGGRSNRSGLPGGPRGGLPSGPRPR